MTQNAFTEKIGVSKITVSRWERGVAGQRDTKLSTFARLCVQPADLRAYLRGEIDLESFLEEHPQLQQRGMKTDQEK